MNILSGGVPLHSLEYSYQLSHFVTPIFGLSSIPPTDNEERRGSLCRRKHENSSKFHRRRVRIWNSAATRILRKKKWGDKVGSKKQLAIEK